MFYNVTVQNPLAVFTNLRIQPTFVISDPGQSDPIVKCDTQPGPFFPSVCTGIKKFEWDQQTDRPKMKSYAGTEKLKKGETPTKLPKAWLGAKLNVLGALDWQFKGLGYVQARFAYALDGKVGIGFRSESDSKLGTKPVGLATCSLIAGEEKSFAGFALFGKLEMCVNISLTSLAIKGSSPIERYRTWRVTASRTGMFSTTGVKFSPQDVKVTKEMNSNIDFERVGWTWIDVMVAVTPFVELSFRTQITVGTTKYWVKTGLELKVVWEFSHKEQDCLSPYLWRKVVQVVSTFYKVPALNILGHTLLKADEHGDTPIPSTIIGGCLFNRRNAQEGYEPVLAMSRPMWATRMTDFKLVYSATKDGPPPTIPPVLLWGWFSVCEDDCQFLPVPKCRLGVDQATGNKDLTLTWEASVISIWAQEKSLTRSLDIVTSSGPVLTPKEAKRELDRRRILQNLERVVSKETGNV
jgi:hypothetical protein